MGRCRAAAKEILKGLRGSQPLNRVATATVRTLLRACNRRSEWVIRHLHRYGGVRFRLPNGRTARLWSRADDWVSNQIYWRGWNGYERLQECDETPPAKDEQWGRGVQSAGSRQRPSNAPRE
jgi:hypothetical protein